MKVKEKEDKKEKKEFVEPELIKHEEKLDEITMWEGSGAFFCGSPH